MKFSDDQFSAASAFVHTMIVVDDEPVAEPEQLRTTCEDKDTRQARRCCSSRRIPRNQKRNFHTL